MDLSVVFLDFLLLAAVLRLTVWPLLGQTDAPRLSAGQPSEGVRPRPPSGGPELPPPTDLIEEEILARKAVLLAVVCPACGRRRDDTDRFCRGCGAGLSARDGESP